MSLAITEVPPSALAHWADISIAFEVREVLAVAAVDGGLGGLTLERRPVDPPYVKDYDRDPECHPARWGARFDVGRWGLLVAAAAGVRVGAAAVAPDTPALGMLQGRRDLAVLWDLRVAPAARGSGVGAALFAAAERWASGRGARWLAVETQNVNAPACRFYARQGCELGAIHRHAYAELPDETQLVWYKRLCPPGGES